MAGEPRPAGTGWLHSRRVKLGSSLFTIALVAAWNPVTYWALWVAVTPGLSYRQAMVLSQSGTALTNTVPGGSGIGVGLLVVAVTLFVMVLRSDRVARRVGAGAEEAASRVRRLLRRPPVRRWGLATVKFRSRASDLLRDRWPATTAAALLSQLSLYLVLLITLRHVGVPDEAVGWAEVLEMAPLAPAEPGTPPA